MFKIIVLSSSGGGNFEVILREQRKNNYYVSKLITDRYCGALNVASQYQVDHLKLNKKSPNFETELLNAIDYDTDLIIACGWLTILSPKIIEKWKGKIINTHPSLLPKYGGTGMYGVHVHEAVMKNKEEYTGATIHYIDETVDGGEIILQKKIKVDYTLTPYEMGGKVYKLENTMLIDAIKIIMSHQVL